MDLPRLPSFAAEETADAEGRKEEEKEEDAAGDDGGGGGRGTWKHGAFHVATTIATPAAYAPLPFALASLGWPFGMKSECLVKLLLLRLCENPHYN